MPADARVPVERALLERCLDTMRRAATIVDHGVLRYDLLGRMSELNDLLAAASPSEEGEDTRRLDAIAEENLMLWPSVDDEKKDFGWRVKSAADTKGHGTFALTLRAAIAAALGAAPRERKNADGLTPIQQAYRNGLEDGKLSAAAPVGTEGREADDAELLDWLDTLPCGISILADAAYPQSHGMTPKQPGFSHTRDLIRTVRKLRAAAPRAGTGEAR